MKKAYIPLLVFLAGALLCTAFGPQLAELAMHKLYPRDFREVVAREAGEFGLEEELVFAVIKAESGFNPNASSRAQAKGLMQLTEETFGWMAGEHPPENGGSDVFDINDNIHCGCALLRRLLDHYGGNLKVALAAYNAGIGNVDRWLEEKEHSANGETLDSIPFPETKAYVRRVVENLGIYRKLYLKDQSQGPAA